MIRISISESLRQDAARVKNCSLILTEREQFGLMGEKDGANGLLHLCFPETIIGGGDGEEIPSE